MKILLINKFYYPRGGDCTYTLNLERLLKDKGHEVAIFACDYPENIPSVWTKYFPSEISFSDSVTQKLKAAGRAILGSGVKEKLNDLLKDFRPDIVHLNNIHSYLSPIICKIAEKNKIPVVWTLHDYKLICPSYSCLNKNEVCELCFTDRLSVLKQRCMKNSLPASLIAYLESAYWNPDKLQKNITFICPSEFMQRKMKQGGYQNASSYVLNNFIYNLSSHQITSKENSYCYIGRISEEKGVETLLKAAHAIAGKLYIVGDGPLLHQLKGKYNSANIIFTGKLNFEGVAEILAKCKFNVVPSEWYENNPFSVIESLCLGTPVLGANIGGIPELIENGKNGLTFESRNVDDLKQKIEEMFSLSFKNEEIAAQAQARFDKENYYNELMKIYNNLLR